MKQKVQIFKVLRITPGNFHSWVESSVGRIRKENKNVPQYLWDRFFGREKEELSWWKRIWFWLKKVFHRFFS